ncbi:MAG: double zinc ribbon domain-containing protein [Candidatus Pacebacteria bacterium]|nr:double zinc ribbon domain-containing protein [Candidatus Paceibacterota bacterium]
MKNIHKYLLNLLFPKKCINCGRENSFLCEDCLSLIEINQIDYCACAQNPIKNKLKCENCPQKISGVFTVLNEKQKLSQNLFLKSKLIPELNMYFSYLIISYLKKITTFDLNDDFNFFYANEDVKKITENISQFTKIPINKKSKNILLITKKYPDEDILEIIQNLEAKNIYIVTLFREIKKYQNESQF